jgi:hypothetical protein
VNKGGSKNKILNCNCVTFSNFYLDLRYFKLNLMKKIITLLLVFGFGIATTSAQETAKKLKKAKTTTAKVQGAGLVFKTETLDYGTIARGSDGKREFTFTNNGNAPLIISNAQGSCGCTVPSIPREPILPGKSSSIGVSYDTNRVGAFTKTVTVTSNAAGQPSKVLTIKGTVTAEGVKS